MTLWEAVEKDQYRRVHRSFVDDIKVNTIGEFDAFLFHAESLPGRDRQRQSNRKIDLERAF